MSAVAPPRWLLLPLALALLCVLLGIACWRIGWAAVLAKPAQDVLVRLDAGRPLQADQLAELTDRIQRARTLQPAAGIYDELAARLALHTAGSAPTSMQRVAAAELAIAAAARAHAVRPLWPYAAVLVAASEDAAGRHGPGFVDAVDAAWRLGRHEARIGEALAGLWLNTNARRAAPALGAAFDAQLAILPETWIDRADRRGSADAACERALAYPRALARCTLLGWRDPRGVGALRGAPLSPAHNSGRQPG